MRRQSFSQSAEPASPLQPNQNTPKLANPRAAPQKERIRWRDILRTSIYVGIGLTIFWLEQALNLTFSLVLIALVVGLIWISVFTAISTSFLWLPVCLICIPLLTTVAILLRYTRLRALTHALVEKLQTEPFKSSLWTKGILPLIERCFELYMKLCPDRETGTNSGYALLTNDGTIRTDGVFSQLSQRSDIFQLQMYYYAALQATHLGSLQGLRVLDVSHGQANCLKFLAKHFVPRTVVGYDPIKRVITNNGVSHVAVVGDATPTPGPAHHMNLAWQLRSEKRFDLILCIETWSKLADRERFLHQVRELLSQSEQEEQDSAPNVDDQQLHKKQRLVIADIFRKDEEEAMMALFSTYFEVEDVIDISINVQKSIIKQADRRQKYLAASSNFQICCETFR